MKILRNILIVLVAALAVMYFMGPAENNVSRSINIDAPVSAVFPYVKSLQQMNRWSPWAKKDPKIVNTFEGTDGQVGSVNHWVSDIVGTGSQEITKSLENELVETKLVFLKPYESTAEASLKVTAGENGSTDVAWGLHSKNGLMERFIFLFNDFDAIIGKDYEEGLASLKELVEKEGKASKKEFQINEIEYPQTNFIGVREVVKLENIQSFFAENLPKVAAAAGDKMTGMPYGIFNTFDEEKQETDMVAAVAVTGKVAGFEKFTGEAGKAIQIDYYGDYEGSAEAHYAMETYMKEKGLELRGLVTEQYITDPMTEPDPNKWLTQITYLVK